MSPLMKVKDQNGAKWPQDTSPKIETFAKWCYRKLD